jgi:hypothetical protein
MAEGRTRTDGHGRRLNATGGLTKDEVNALLADAPQADVRA